MNPMQKLILLFVAALVCGVMTACGPDLLELDPQEPSDDCRAVGCENEPRD